MSFVVKVRGAGGSILHEYLCDEHGRFEQLVDRVESPDAVPCPTCGASSPWSPSSAPAVHTQFVISATQGKSAPKPHKMSMDHRPMAEGQKYGAWKRERKKLWEEHRHARVKALLE